MSLPELIKRARQGDAQAIARLIIPSLAAQGVTANAHWQGDQLYIALEADQPISRAQTVPAIRRGFRRLGLTRPLESVHLTSRQVGHPDLDWQESFSLNPSPSPATPASSASLPSPSAPSPEDGVEEEPSCYQSDTALASLAHLAPLFGYLIVTANWLTRVLFWGSGFFLLPWRIIAPLALLLAKGRDSPFIEQQAKEALNFQLSMVIYWLITLPLMFILIGLPIAALLVPLEVISTIIAAVKASEGKTFRYPLTIRFVR
ncbi:MAG: DUF4870 domain-containing protein [Nodosilinea sp.]